jgi:hypothetical protein
VLITNEFHEFCWSTISWTSNDRKEPYGPKSIRILIISKIRGFYGQYDTKGRHGIGPKPSWIKVRPVGPTPLASRPVPSAFLETVVTTCQSKSVSGVSNVAKMVEQLNLAAWPSCMAGRPDKWASHGQSSTRAPSYSYKNPHAPPSRECEESEV